MYVGRIGEKRNAYQIYTSGEEKNFHLKYQQMHLVFKIL